MEAIVILPISLSVIGALLTLLCIIIGWIGSRLVSQVTHINEKLETHAFKTQDKINLLSHRVARLELMTET